MSYYSFLPKLINMSLTASVAIVLVILLRLLLKKAPKVISYALWGVVLFRLLCPVSIGSNFSVYNLFDTPAESAGTVTSVIEYVPSDIVHTEYPTVILPVPGISDGINETLPQGEEQLRADPLEGPLFLATLLWMMGVSVMVIYSIVSYVRLRRKLLVVVPLRHNIFIADDIKSPFVVGLFRLRIYLPCDLSEKEQAYIILHEQHHIKRFDHIAKALAFLALTIHWFNPLVWVAFTLAGKDMEMSCDEAVIRKVGSDVRADYSASLLTLATGRRIIAGTPLAFGEGDTKGRILNLSKWKKPAVWVVALASVACIVLALSLLTNPQKLTIYDIFEQNGYSVVSQDAVDITLYVEKSKLPDAIYTADGHEFKPNEVLAYSTETSRIYLHKAMVSNESDDLLYLIFDCSYDLPESGSFVSPYQYVEKNDSTLSTLHLRSNDLRDSSTTYPDALDMRGHGPGSQFAFYVSKEACMTAEGTLMIDVICNQIEYAKSGHGYDSQQASGIRIESGNITSVMVDKVEVSDEAASELISLINSHRCTSFQVGADDPNSLSRAIQLNCTNGDSYLLHYQYYSGLSFDPNHAKGGDYRSILTFFTAEEGGTQAWKMEQSFDAKLQQWLSKYAPSNQPAASEVDPLDAAIRSAIIEVNKHPEDPVGLYHCASFVLLDKEEISGTPVVGSTDHVGIVTVYGLALYQGYTLVDDRIYEETGSHIPVAITFDVLNGKYSLKEYWQPGDGSYYVSDIREKFPDKIEEEALDTQKYIRAQIQNCYTQAVEFGGIDTNAAMEHLFGIIESCPLQSSNPGDYIDEHYIEYRELTYYGQYTLRYCFEQFLQGGQTGLRGHLMRALLDDLAPEAQLKLQAMTGQEYFDEWKAAALRLGEQHDMDWIKGNQPAVYLLLQMMAE